MRTAHVRFAALAALTAALCTGCKNDQPAAHSTQRPAGTVTTPGATPRVTVAEPVTRDAFVAALAKQRRFLPDIGFEMRVGADGQIAYLKQIYRP